MNDQEKIKAKLETVQLGHGVGTENNPCTIAAINLALSGGLTDRRPDCVSPVMHQFVVNLQDALPIEILNSVEYRRFVPLLAGTDDGRDNERLDIIMDWMWTVALPPVQPIANKLGFGLEWSAMLREKTVDAGDAAANAATGTTDAYVAGDAAANAAHAAANASSYTVDYAANAAAKAAAVVGEGYWQTVRPIELLDRLVSLGESKGGY